MKDLPVGNPDEVKGGSMDGIGYLVAVTQLKSSNANDSASKAPPRK